VGNCVCVNFDQVRTYIQARRKAMSERIQMQQTQPHPSELSRTEHAQARSIDEQTKRALANGKLRPVSQEDPDLLAKSECCRGRGETLMQFFSRTGVTASQLRTMSRQELIDFVDRAGQQDPPPDAPRGFFREPPAPPQPRVKTILWP
jgi:hypothetical protein